LNDVNDTSLRNHVDLNRISYKGVSIKGKKNSTKRAIFNPNRNSKIKQSYERILILIIMLRVRL